MNRSGYNLEPADLASLARQGNVIPLCREMSAARRTPVAAFLRIARGGRNPVLL